MTSDMRSAAYSVLNNRRGIPDMQGFPGRVDPYFNNVAFLMNADSYAGVNTICDLSKNKHAIALVGDTKFISQTTAAGEGGVYFDGTGDYTTTPHSSVFDMGSGDFTWEVSCKLSNMAAHYLIAKKIYNNNPGSGDWAINTNSGDILQIGVVPAANIGRSFSFPWAVAGRFDEWVDIAVVKYNNVMYAFRNGRMSPDTYADVATYNNSNAFNLGDWDTVVPSVMKGYLRRVRITPGIARVTSDYIPSKLPFPTR